MNMELLVTELAKNQLLQGCAPRLRRQRKQSAATSKSARCFDSSSSSLLKLQLVVRGCNYHATLRAANNDASSPSVFSTNIDCFYRSSVKISKGRSCRCPVLSSAAEAHALTLLQARPLLADDYSDPTQNEEAEGAIKVLLENLRALLRLWDIDNRETDCYELLVVADYLERLGLDVYFRQEIKFILDYIFRVWTASSLIKSATLMGDLQSVALAFYLLRSHKYDVKPGIFLTFRKEDGSFCKKPQHAAHDSADVGALLNLLRASDLRFSCDDVLQDAHEFASSTLRGLLDGQGEPLPENTSAEVMYRLKYPWAINLRMLETRHTILNFQEDSVTANFSRLSSRAVSLMLCTATRLVNEYISMFQQEIQSLERWNKESGLEEVNIRSNLVMLPAYLSLAYDMPQAKYAFTREVYAKAFYIFIILDDLYDLDASMDHLILFNEAVRSWDPSILEKLPEDQGQMSIRVIYKAIFDLTSSLAKKSAVWYRCDLQTFIHHWMVRLEVYVNERAWVESGYQLTLAEYLNEFAKWSFTCETGVPLAYYSLPGGKVSHSFFETRPDMKALFSIQKTARFFNDARSYQYEKLTEARGKNELIGILMRENPQLTEKEAVELVECYAMSGLKETTEEILCFATSNWDIKTILLSNYRLCILLYYTVDGLRNPDHLLSKLIEPLPNMSIKN